MPRADMDTGRHYSPFVGRLLIALPFLDFAYYKLTNWDMMRGWLQFNELPLPALLLGTAIVIEFLGAIGLAAGFKTRWLAVVLILYLVPVHLSLHDFWTLEAGPERQAQVENFGKGLMIMGGLLFVFAHGAGPLSVDGRPRT